MSVIPAYGLLAHGMIFGALVALLPLGIRRPSFILVAIATAIISGLASAMHGVFGAPSLTLLQLAVLQVTSRTPSPLTYRAALSLLLFSLLFYAATLGWGSFDPYALGYQPRILLFVLIPLGGLLWLNKVNIWLGVLAIDLLGYASGLFPNLWDALFDLLLVLIALIVVGRQWVIRFR